LAQLLLQVSGRAGREEQAGEVLIQTHHPEHPLLQILIREGYNAFAEKALEERKQANLPPFSYLVLLSAESLKSEQAALFLNESSAILKKYPGDIELLGPTIAPFEKREGRYRWQLLLMSHKRSALHSALKNALPEIDALKSGKKVRWSIDVDPIDTN
jgi:primosomal protein N' (replication factor Y)